LSFARDSFNTSSAPLDNMRSGPGVISAGLELVAAFSWAKASGPRPAHRDNVAAAATAAGKHRVFIRSTFPDDATVPELRYNVKFHNAGALGVR
jgi:hypothetical protein